MRPITLILIAIALVFSGGAAFFAKKVVTDKPAMVVGEDGELVKAEPMTKVLVAAKLVEAGKVLAKKDMRWQKWPKGSLHKTYISGGQADKLKQFTGAMVISGFLPGEPIVSDKVFMQGSSSFMTGFITPGMRALSMPLSPAMGVLGHIKPGDRVDILHVYEIGMQSEESTSFTSLDSEMNIAQVLLENRRVLAVGATTSDMGEKADTSKTKNGKKKKKKATKKAKMPKSITLELTPHEVLVLSLAKSRGGSIVFALRSYAETPDAENWVPKSPEQAYGVALEKPDGTFEVYPSRLPSSSSYLPVESLPDWGPEPTNTPADQGGYVRFYRGGRVSTEGGSR